MPRPAQRTRSLRRLKKKTPSGRYTTHYVRRRPSAAKCAECSKELHAVPRKRPKAMQKTPKTKKRPERKYGGVLCASCLKVKIKRELYQK